MMLLVGVLKLEKPPEYFKYKHSTYKSDIYSFGIIIWEIITRKTPFTTVEIANEFDFPNQVKAVSCPQKLKMLIEKCWNNDPELRPTADQVVKYLKNI